uniref:Uncharacterized protein n=1 Tax=Anopheles christyi TaxID=43041 RepID=A0A182KCW6_9DIPT
MVKWLGLVFLCVVTIFTSLNAAQDVFSILKPVGNPLGSGIRKKLYVTRVGQCAGKKNLPVYVPDMRIAAYNRTNYAVSGEAYFREDIPSYRLSVAIKQCDDIRATINCRPFLSNIVNTDGCALLQATGTMYNEYLKKFRPPLRCPFWNGTYVMEPTLVDDGLVKYLPGSGSTYWEVRMTGRVKERLMYCIVMQLNNHLANMFDMTILSEWLQSVDAISVVFFACGVTLFYLVMNMALRIIALLFWPTVVIIGLLFFRSESFAALVTETVKRVSETALREILPVQ